MDKSSKKTSAFNLSGEKIARLLSIGREDDLSGVVHENDYVADLRIEGYEIVEKIAEAGQGQVWRAIQLSTGRQVAIKSPRVKSVNSEGAMLRFEREIELVARLEHPHIARIYDSGVDRGQYYYVMDFIGGLNLDEYVRKNKLTHRQILELVRTICRAVQHAHQNRVIHRDLKPSNIIITGDGHPYVVDFGLAKAILEDEQGPTISMDGETVGTPAYMSPEQAAGRVDEVDTRTDIYSLGVILFNLLTGESPHDLSGSRQQVLRRIADGQVKRPRTVCRSIDRDLETLLLKTLDRDPDRRYSTASGLADDIENYLDGAPLMAGPPSTTYRLKKFVRRNVALSSAVFTAVVILVIGLITTTTMYLQADHARAEAQAMSDFLRKDVLWSLDLWRTGGQEINARSVLDAVSEKLKGKFADKPLVEASIRRELGATYTFFGLYEAAEQQFKRTLEIHRSQLGAEHKDTFISMWDVGWVYWWQSRYHEAEPLLTEALEGMELTLDEDNEDRLYCMAILAWLYGIQGRFNEAEQLFGEGLSILHHVLGEENVYSPTFMHGLARVYYMQGHYDKAELLYNDALELSRRVRGEQDLESLSLMNSLGELCWDQGRYDEAEQLLVKALDSKRNVLGEQHLMTFMTMTSLARLYHSQGRYKQAESLLIKTMETPRVVLGDEHDCSFLSMYGLGAVYLSQGRYDRAETLLTKALEIERRVLGEENWATLKVINTLAKLYTAQRRYAEAEELFLETIETRKRKLGNDHPDTLETMNDLGLLYKEQSNYQKAEELLLEALKGRRLKLGDTHPHTLESWQNLIKLYEAWDKPEKAKEWRAKLPQTEAVNE